MQHCYPIFLKKFEGLVPSHRNYELFLEMPNLPGQISKITNVLTDLNVRVRDIKVDSGDGDKTCAFFNLVLPPGIDKLALGAELSRLQGISLLEKEVNEDK